MSSFVWRYYRLWMPTKHDHEKRPKIEKQRKLVTTHMYSYSISTMENGAQ